MATPRMGDADYAVHKPYVEEILTLINQHIRRHPDPNVLEAAWRVGYLTILTEIVRVTRLVPDQVEDYLSRVLAALHEEVLGNVRQWDADGPHT